MTLFRRFLFVTLFLITATVVFSHEFWLLPERFFVDIGKATKVVVEVGEDFTGEPWGGGTRRVESLQLHTASGVKNLMASVEQSDSGVALPMVSLESTGTQILTLTTNSSFIELEPDKFLAYLKEDGLENVIEYRVKNNETNKNGLENYRRCAKTLLQVGAQYNNSPSKNTGMILEIIPSKNPYQLSEKESLTCQFLYQQKPMKNTLVRCWWRVNGKTEVEFKRTNGLGNATFDLVKKGRGSYMISTVRMVRLASKQKADWQSTWGSLTFGKL